MPCLESNSKPKSMINFLFTLTKQSLIVVLSFVAKRKLKNEF